MWLVARINLTVLIIELQTKKTCAYNTINFMLCLNTTVNNYINMNASNSKERMVIFYCKTTVLKYKTLRFTTLLLYYSMR